MNTTEKGNCFPRFSDIELIDILYLLGQIEEFLDRKNAGAKFLDLVNGQSCLVQEECDARHIRIKYLPTGGYITEWYGTAGKQQ